MFMMFKRDNEWKQPKNLSFHLLSCSKPWFNRKYLELKSPPLYINKTGFSEIFCCKEFAGGRPDKARGCVVPIW